MCSQCFDGVYKFSFGAYDDNVDSTFCALWGDGEQNNFVTQFTDRTRGTLPVSQSLLDCGDMHCIKLSLTDDKTSYIARFWNHSSQAKKLHVKIQGKPVQEFTICDVFGKEQEQKTDVMVAPKSVITVTFKY